MSAQLMDYDEDETEQVSGEDLLIRARHGVSRLAGASVEAEFDLEEDGEIYVGVAEGGMTSRNSDVGAFLPDSRGNEAHVFTALTSLVLGRHPLESTSVRAIRDMRALLKSHTGPVPWVVPGQLSLIEAQEIAQRPWDVSHQELRRAFTADDDVIAGALVILKVASEGWGRLEYRDEGAFEVLRRQALHEHGFTREFAFSALAATAELERGRQLIVRSKAGIALAQALGLPEPAALPAVRPGGAPVPDDCTVHLPRGYRLHSDGVQLYAMPTSEVKGAAFNPARGFAVTGEVLASWAAQEAGRTDGTQMAGAVRDRIASTRTLRREVAGMIRPA